MGFGFKTLAGRHPWPVSRQMGGCRIFWGGYVLCGFLRARDAFQAGCVYLYFYATRGI